MPPQGGTPDEDMEELDQELYNEVAASLSKPNGTVSYAAGGEALEQALENPKDPSTTAFLEGYLEKILECFLCQKSALLNEKPRNMCEDAFHCAATLLGTMVAEGDYSHLRSLAILLDGDQPFYAPAKQGYRATGMPMFRYDLLASVQQLGGFRGVAVALEHLKGAGPGAWVAGTGLGADGARSLVLATLDLFRTRRDGSPLVHVVVEPEDFHARTAEIIFEQVCLVALSKPLSPPAPAIGPALFFFFF